MSSERPDFLDDELERVIHKIGNGINRQLVQENQEKAHIIENMSNHMKSSYRRAIISGVIGDYLSDFNQYYLDYTANMCGLVIDDRWFARIIKIEDLDEVNPPGYPKTIRQAILRALEKDILEETQLPLFEVEEKSTSSKIELGKLQQGILGYVMDHNGLLLGFTFAEYIENGNKVQKVYQLDLNSGLQTQENTSAQEFAPSNPSTTIKLKPSHTPSIASKKIENE